MIHRERQRSNGQAPPALAIPDEITSAIFLYTLPTFHWTDHKLMRVDIYHSNYFLLDSQMSSHQAALNLAHVCRSWRRVALSTKGLWSDFIFRPNETVEKEAFEHALQLSGKRNLKFAFHADETAFGDKSLVWRTLQENIECCTALSVISRKSSDLNEMYQILSSAKELSSLTITMGEVLRSYLPGDMPQFEVSVLPKLQQLILARVRCGIMPTTTLRPPITQLDHLSTLVLLQETPWTDALKWFSSCPKLSFVHLILSETEPPSGQDQVTLPLLQHLKISFVPFDIDNDEPGTHGYIFEHLVCPSLGTLIVDSPNEGGAWAKALRGALVRSSAPLSTLNLRGWLYADPSDIIDILEECGNLSRLSISKLLLSSQVQDALMPKEKGGRLISEYMPQLESLTILNSTGTSFSIGTLLDIVCARSNDAVTDCERLKHAALAMDVLVLNEYIPKYNKFPVLQKCCDKGLRFQPPLPVSGYVLFLAQ